MALTPPRELFLVKQHCLRNTMLSALKTVFLRPSMSKNPNLFLLNPINMLQIISESQD